uniref:Bm7528 n=1 Tax=Brugia malayi TaxID=6279 RepID=A0A0I9N836_BRUMA|nr:Bm7528 [Brugia malayi]
MPVLCCYAKRRRARTAAKSQDQCRQGTRLAKLDEFESLTPLMVMSSGDNQTQSSLCYRISATTSRSPPPPRCLTSGKTMIVPLNSGKGCALFAPLLATPDSKVASFENGTTKTIAEDNDSVPISSNLDKFDADFISIDRTTASYLEPRQQRFQQCQCGISKQDKAPSFELPIPSYAPPPLPLLLVRSPRLNLRKELPLVIEANNGDLDIDNVKTNKSPSINSMNSLGSPQESSFSMGSPLDTSASISDSFCVAGEGEMNSGGKGRVSCFETGKIEEESEQNGDVETVGMVTSQTLDSIKSNFSHPNQADSEYNIIIPHSISQQVKLGVLSFSSD